ncbi:MAG: hypothetical protein U0559_12280 [Anaerolineae bacterium]
MEQLSHNVEQLLNDLESYDFQLRQTAARKLGEVSISEARIVLALEKVASAGGSPFDGSAQAAAAARAALQTPAHRDILQQLGHELPVQEKALTPTTNWKKFLILVGVGLLGMLLAYLIFPSSVYFVEWQDFPSPPAGIVELLTFKQDASYLLVGRMANGETYTYHFYDGWLRSDDSITNTSEQVFAPCTYSPPEFGPFNNVPSDIISCATAKSFPGYVSSNIYALDKNGHVWRWEMGGGFKEPFADYVTRPCLGGLIGLLLGGWIITRSKRLHAPRKDGARTILQ